MSGTKKEVRDWKITGTGADYFRITDYGLLQMDWEPAYVEHCVTAIVTAILENGRKLAATVRAYSKLNIYTGKTLVYADGKFYVIITSFNEPKPRKYGIYEISGTALEELAKQNDFDLDYFHQ